MNKEEIEKQILDVAQHYPSDISWDIKDEGEQYATKIKCMRNGSRWGIRVTIPKDGDFPELPERLIYIFDTIQKRLGE